MSVSRKIHNRACNLEKTEQAHCVNVRLLWQCVGDVEWRALALQQLSNKHLRLLLLLLLNLLLLKDAKIVGNDVRYCVRAYKISFQYVHTANAIPAGALAMNLVSCSCTNVFILPDCCVSVEITGAVALAVTVVVDRLLCACIVDICLLYKCGTCSENSIPDGAQ